METLEAWSYVVTILGFPAAMLIFVHEQRKERANEVNELHRNLSEEYDNFLRLVLQNADLLLLRRRGSPPELDEEQMERRDIIFRMLVGLFEKAYILLHAESMGRDASRRWQSWEDDMQEWCGRDDFRALLPMLLEGEDDEFSRHIRTIAERRASAGA